MNWLRFLRAVGPDLVKLARYLFERFGGDAGKARAEISRIRNHGARLDETRAEVDRAMDELRKGQK